MGKSFEQEILMFIWKWKALSSSALYMRFFQHLKPISAYSRLESLKLSGLIQQVYDPFGHIVLWTLSKKGFDAIKLYLPTLTEEGYLSENLMHDYWVTAVNLGEGLDGCPSGAETFSEQELRRLSPDVYPSWVPVAKSHRPDGYWCVGTGEEKRVVALEVELSRKSQDKYLATCEFYRTFPHVSLVIWVVESAAHAKNLHACFKQWGDGDRHQFLTLDSFELLGWEAPLLVGGLQGATLNKILLNPQSKSGKTFYFDALLDGQKCPKFPRIGITRLDAQSATGVPSTAYATQSAK